MSKYTDKQNSLQSEAKNILDKIGLMDFLSKFGEAKIVGSVALGLMTWPDIDIDLSVNELKEEEYLETVKFLFDSPEVIRLVLADNRILTEDLKSQGIPESIYLGVFARGKNYAEWKVDIRFVATPLVRAEKYIEEIKGKLNAENKEIILEIKNAICSHPKYLAKKISSVDVYRAVLDENVKDLEGFKEYLRGKGIEL